MKFGIAAFLALLLWCLTAAAQSACPAQRLEEILNQLDGARMKRTVEKLVSFGTRHSLSDTTSSTRGIGAARKWIFDELSAYAQQSGGRMTVLNQTSKQKSRRTKDQEVDMVNVVAVIRGATDPQRVYIATGHYDSINRDINDAEGDAPGANDDASGTAVVMEIARVLAASPADATIVLAALAGEEQGLLGARGLVEYARTEKWNVEGMVTNDIVGGIEGVSGHSDTRTLRVFSANTKVAGDSTSRHWARYVRETAGRHLPWARVRLIHRIDRFRRGGDHIPFFDAGIPAIRFTEAEENFRRQHQNVRTENGVQFGDLPQYVSGDYMRLVASVNTAVLVSAACAPAAPVKVTASAAGSHDTTLKWEAASEPDLAGYELLIRETTADEWEEIIPIGKVNTYTAKGVSIDNYFFGVRALDRDGNRSPVRTPEEPR